MKTYRVSAINVEYLLAVEVKANNAIEAEEKYLKMWDNGELGVNDSDLSVETKEIIKWKSLGLILITKCVEALK